MNAVFRAMSGEMDDALFSSITSKSGLLILRRTFFALPLYSLLKTPEEDEFFPCPNSSVATEGCRNMVVLINAGEDLRRDWTNACSREQGVGCRPRVGAACSVQGKPFLHLFLPEAFYSINPPSSPAGKRRVPNRLGRSS